MSTRVMNSQQQTVVDKKKDRALLWKQIKRYKFVYLLLFPAIILMFIFAYCPMPGVIIAFMDYDPYEMWNSPFVGFKNFVELFQLPMFTKAIWNTIHISVLNLIIAFPINIIFALMLNELRQGIFKKTVQTISYLPHFLSWISVIGMVVTIYSLNGPINDLVVKLGGERTMWLAKQNLFVPNNIFLGVWKGMGWGSIIYLAAISGVDTSLYEAAIIDGATKFQQTRHITLPAIVPTIIIMLIWAIGGIFGSNFELVYGLQNAFVDYEVISTVTYKMGIEAGEFSLTTAFGLFQGFINFALIATTNYLAKRFGDTSLW